MSIQTPKIMKLSLVCSSVFMSLLSTSSHAENEAEVTSLKENTIERIVVTSRKRTETIVEIPMNVSVVSEMEISDRNLNTTNDVFRTIAGAADPRGELILRGLSGSNDSTPGTTSTFTDGIPYSFDNLYDVERMEVLRGPQGTLYGSNAIGGTVRIITTKPQIGEFEFKTSLQANYQERSPGQALRIDGAVNVPINDSLALRVTGSFSDDPEATVNVNTGVQGYDKDTMVRTQLLWQIEDDFNINFAYIHESSKTVGDGFSDLSHGFQSWRAYYTVDNPDALFGQEVIKAENPDCADPRPVCLNGGPHNVDPKYAIWELQDEYTNGDFDLFSINLEHEDVFGFASLNYAGSFRVETKDGLDDWSRGDGKDMFKTWIIAESDTERTTHEIRLQDINTNDNFDWTVGYFYDKSSLGNGHNGKIQYHENDDSTKALATELWGNEWGYLGGEFVSVDGQTTQQIDDIAQLGAFYWGDEGTNYERQTIENWSTEQALFGEVSYTADMGDIGEFEFTAGIRFYELEDENHTVLFGVWNGEEPTVKKAGGKESGNRIKLSASWRPTDDMSVYGLYSEGYRPGGNNLPQLPQSCRDDENAQYHNARYESDEIENYEIGYKGAFVDSGFSFALAAYHINWQGVQAPIYMGECGFRFTANAATAQSQGIEFESQLHLDNDITLSFNFGYTDAKMTDDVPSLDVENGDDMTMVPKYNGYFAIDKGFDLFGRQAYVRADISAYGAYESSFDPDVLDEIPAYELVNLSSRIEINDNLDMSLHINNLLDEDYITYKTSGSNKAEWVVYGKDRNVTLRVNYTF